jgi:hypothetical protein
MPRNDLRAWEIWHESLLPPNCQMLNEGRGLTQSELKETYFDRNRICKVYKGARPRKWGHLQVRFR